MGQGRPQGMTPKLFQRSFKMGKILWVSLLSVSVLALGGTFAHACSEIEFNQKASADLMADLIAINTPGTFSDTDQSIAKARSALFDVPGAGEVIVVTLKVNVVNDGVKNQSGL